jgi:hypothetical protein
MERKCSEIHLIIGEIYSIEKIELCDINIYFLKVVFAFTTKHLLYSLKQIHF